MANIKCTVFWSFSPYVVRKYVWPSRVTSRDVRASQIIPAHVHHLKLPDDQGYMYWMNHDITVEGSIPV